MTYPNGLRYLSRFVRALHQTGRFPATPREITRLRKSEILFILGSGLSINEIVDWPHIASHDSVGFNFWLIHDFVPDLYFIETPSVGKLPSCPEASTREMALSGPGRLRRETMKRLVAHRAEAYRDTHFFLKIRSGASEIKEVLDRHQLNWRPFVSLNFACSKASILKSEVHHFVNSGVRKRQFRSQGVAGVELLTLIGLQMGYSQIVLCGVDLYDTEYFFNAPEFAGRRQAGLIPPVAQVGVTHKTNDPMQAWGGVPVSEVLEVYAELSAGLGVELFIENKESPLADVLPTYSADLRSPI